MLATRKQIAAVQIARQQLELSDDDYRAILHHCGGVESSKELDQTGWEFVIQYMMALGFRPAFAVPFFGHRPGFASPGQVRLIRSLWHEYTGGQGDDVTLGKWLDRSFHVTALRFVTVGQARKVIAALMKMKNRPQDRRKAG